MSRCVHDNVVALRASDQVGGIVDVAARSVGQPFLIEVSGTQGMALLTNTWSGGGHLTITGEIQDFDDRNLHATQIGEFSTAAATNREWKGATVADGVAVVDLVIDAIEHNRETP